jgi:hypothetical protein
MARQNVTSFRNIYCTGSTFRPSVTVDIFETHYIDLSAVCVRALLGLLACLFTTPTTSNICHYCPHWWKTNMTDRPSYCFITIWEGNMIAVCIFSCIYTRVPFILGNCKLQKAIFTLTKHTAQLRNVLVFSFHYIFGINRSKICSINIFIISS